MDKEELKNEILSPLEKVIKFSLKNNLSLHTSFGGRYAELWVAYEL
ncbi:MAG: hypothetical protein QXE78_09230 [Nitrososphaeria archaeon]